MDEGFPGPGEISFFHYTHAGHFIREEPQISQWVAVYINFYGDVSPGSLFIYFCGYTAHTKISLAFLN
jgi:hypothetical protein